MSFEAKKLRVQLPCGEATRIHELQPCIGGTACNTGTACHVFNSCGIATPVTCIFPTHFCHFPTHYPCPFHTCPFGTCGFNTPITCLFGSRPCGVSPLPDCPAGSGDPIDPGTILIDPEDLPALREHLESQLEEIEKAEQALREHEGK